jgi:hypothetical protein
MSRRRPRHAASLGLALSAVAALMSCSRAVERRPPPPAEFLVSAEDSSFWITSGPEGVHVRGSPILLARYDGRFYEVYSADDDYSFENALLVGTRLYRRDILSGDSALVFADTAVPSEAVRYARAHPGERRVGPDEEVDPDAPTSATAEVDVLEVFGPYLSYEYRADMTIPGRRPSRTTRQGVIDLRTGRQRTLADLFGAPAAKRLIAEGRRAYDSARRNALESRGSDARDRAALAALAHRTFDERSFNVIAVDGKPSVTFVVPGSGEGPEGADVPLEPIDASPTAWWSTIANQLPSSADESDVWRRPTYTVRAFDDSATSLARMLLTDTAGRAWPIGVVGGPIHRIDWLDSPPIAAPERAALKKAFDDAGSYDEGRRIAALPMGVFRHAAMSLTPVTPVRHARRRARRP